MFSTPPAKKRPNTRAYSRSRATTPFQDISPSNRVNADSISPGPTPITSSYSYAQHLSKRLDGTPASLRRSARRSMLNGRPSTPLVADDLQSMSGVLSTISSLDGFRSDNDPSLLAKDDCVAALMNGKLPDKFLERLLNFDPYREPIFAYIDKSVSFAVVILPDMAYVWSVKKRVSTTTPLCLSFPLEDEIPVDVRKRPAAILTNLPNSKEPGLIVVLPSGKIQYWESINYALSGVGQFKSADLKFEYGESIVDFIECETSIHYLATNKHIYKISLSTPSGQNTLNVHAVTKMSGVISKVSGLFGSNSSLANEGDIIALSAAPGLDQDTTSRIFYALTVTNLIAFKAHNVHAHTHSEEIIQSTLIFDEISRTIANDISQDPNIIPLGLNLRFLRMQHDSNNKLHILGSYSSMVDAKRSTGIVDEQSQSYFIITLKFEHDNLPRVEMYSPLSYRDFEDPRPSFKPQLIVSPDNVLAFVVFSQAIVITSIEAGLTYEETLSLKSSPLNLIIGTSRQKLELIDLGSEGNEIITNLTILTRQHAIAFQVNLSAVRKEGQDLGIIDDEERAHIKQTSRLKSKLEQGVFFGSISENPLSLAFTETIVGDLDIAAVEVSNEILEGRSPFFPTILDLRANLHERLNKLNILIKWIRMNGILDKLSPTSRLKLCENAEKIAAGLQLWQIQNDMQARIITTLDSTETNEELLKNQKLAKAILLFLENRTDSMMEEGVKGFFLYHLSSIGELLPILRSAISVTSSSNTFKGIQLHLLDLYEINDAILAILKSALQYREENRVIYVIDVTTGEPWTSNMNVISVVQEEFEDTVKNVQDIIGQQDSTGMGLSRSNGVIMNGDFEMVEDQDAMENLREITDHLYRSIRNQVPELAGVLLQLFADKIASNKVGNDITQLEKEFSSLRPNIIKAVSGIDGNRSFELAEIHNDFRTLIELSHLSSVKTSNYLNHYMTKYKEEFAFVLYRWYVEQGKLRSLLEQDSSYNELLSKFLNSDEYSKIAWIHSLEMQDYTKSARILIKNGYEEMDVQKRKFLFSIGKLCQLVDMDEKEFEDNKNLIRNDIDIIDEQIELVNIQEGLQTDFNDIIKEHSGIRKTLDQKTDIVIKVNGLGVQKFPNLLVHYKNIVRGILSGSTMNFEDLVDVLTLKDNIQDEVDDYWTAMKVYEMSGNLSEGRRHTMLCSIWRRTYIHDDWEVIVNNSSVISDEELMDHLRDTAVYCVLKMIFERHSNISILSPQESMFIGTEDEMIARFSSLPLMDIKALTKEYQDENERIQEAIERWRLNEYWAEIKRLAKHDQGYNIEEENLMETDM